MSILALAFVVVLSACGSGEEDEASTDTGGNDADSNLTLIDEGKFSYAASGEYKPFSYMNMDNEMEGFDIDVANAVAEELGLEPVQNRYKFSAIVEGVKTGRFDAAVASHTITPEREEQVDFSDAYYYSGAQIFTQPGSEFEKLEDLEGKDVAVSKGSTYQKYADEVTEDVSVYDSDVVALQALAKGQHDAVITDFLTGKEAIGNDLDIEARSMIERSEQAIAVSKENPELLEAINEALKTLREDGTLTEISQEYFGEDITTKPE